jgi:hypothetical protein
MSDRSPSTDEVLALRKLGRTVDERFAEWAISLLMEGQDTPALRVLAGESPPSSPSEMEALADRAFAELGIVQHPGIEAAARSLAAFRARQVLAGQLARDVALQELAELYMETDDRALQDFYLLHHARDDLQQGEVQWYWPAGRAAAEDVRPAVAILAGPRKGVRTVRRVAGPSRRMLRTW